MSNGFPSTAKRSMPWTTADTQAYAASVAVGVLAGIAITYARTPLHLPGHKAIFWIAPVLIARLLTGARAGSFAGACAAATTAAALGGRLAGGMAMVPLLGLAGALLDLAVWEVQRSKRSIFATLLVLSLAGAGANLICFINRIFEPAGELFSSRNLHELLGAAIWYAAFGLAAGLAGAIVGLGLLRTRKQGGNLR